VHTRNLDAQPFICDRIFFFDVTRDYVHLGLCLRETDAVFQTCDAAQTVIRTRKHLGGEGKRHPQFCNLGKLKSGWHHTDDCVSTIVEYELLPDNVRFTAKTVLPDTVSDDYDGVLLGSIFISGERSTLDRRHP